MKVLSVAGAALAMLALLFAGCASGNVFQSSGPSVALEGISGGVIDLSLGTSDTVHAAESNYHGSYAFTIANASVATLSVPPGSSSVHRDATSTVTVTQGNATITPVAAGSTTLTVQTTNATTTVSLVVSATSPSSGPSSSPSSSPTASPTPTAPPPGVLSANPTTLSFYASGSNAAQTVLVQETSFSGSLSETNTCSGIVTISPTSSTSPYSAVVTPVAAGTCTITFSDGTQTAPVGVTVTTAGITVNTKGARP